MKVFQPPNLYSLGEPIIPIGKQKCLGFKNPLIMIYGMSLKMVTSKSENGVMVPKPKQEWDELDKNKVQLNVKVVYILHCAINRNESNRV